MKQYGRIINWARVLGFSPFKWSHKKEEITVLTNFDNKWSSLTTKTKIFVPFAQTVFMILQSVRAVMGFTGDIPTLRKMQMVYYATGYAVFSVNFLPVFQQNGTAIPSIMNNLMRIKKQSTGYFMNGIAHGEKRLATALTFLHLVIMIFIPVTNSVSILWEPTSWKYVTSLHSNPKETSFALKIVVGLFHMYSTAFTFSVFMINTGTVLVSAHIVSNVLTGVQDELNSSKPASMKHAAVMNRKLAVLMEHFNATFSIWTFLIEVMVIVAVVLNSSIGILFLSVRSALVSIAALVILMTVFGNLGNVYDRSKKLIIACRSMKHSPLLTRHYIATQELKVKVGSFFYADRSLILTILSTILTNTVNVVMGSMTEV